MDDLHRLKRALRRRMRDLRCALSDAEAAELAARAADRLLALHELREARVVLCYVSIRDELPTRGLLARLLDAGKTLAVPRVDTGLLRAHRLDDLGALVPGDYGIPTSDGPDVSEAVELCVTPGLAFDPAGGRIGYGGGFYDRFLAARPRALPVGLCYDVQVVEDLPLHTHDHPMAAIVTPARTIRVDPTGGRAADR